LQAPGECLLSRCKEAEAEAEAEAQCFSRRPVARDGSVSTVNSVQATPDNPVNAPPDTQQTPRNKVFHPDSLLNEVVMELIWLGEESMYRLVCPESNLNISTGMRRLH
jgi:hypothetical protein